MGGLLILVQQIIESMQSLLGKFKENENVLYFLLRKRDKLTETFGVDLIHRLFNTASKKNKLGHFLIMRYQARGFDHRIPLIKQELSVYGH